MKPFFACEVFSPFYSFVDIVNQKWGNSPKTYFDSCICFVIIPFSDVVSCINTVWIQIHRNETFLLIKQGILIPAL